MNGCSNQLIKSSRKTILELLHDRGYDIDQNKDELIADTQKMIRATNLEGKIIQVVFILVKRQIPLVKEYIAQHCLNTPNTNHIVVTQHAVNKTFRALCDNYNIEIFDIKSLGINITKHSLVPEHILHTEEEEKEQLKQKIQIEDWSQIPQMYITDPIARYYGAKQGDVFEIVRNSKTAGRYSSYRHCIC